MRGSHTHEWMRQTAGHAAAASLVVLCAAHPSAGAPPAPPSPFFARHEGGAGGRAGEGDALSLAPADLATFEPSIRARLVEALERADRAPSAAAFGDLGMLLHAYDRVDRAAACYARARTLAPQAFEWAYYQGVALAMAGDVDRAAAILDEARQLVPADVPVRLRLADLQLEQGRVEASARTYRSVLRDRPTSAGANYGLGRALAASSTGTPQVAPTRGGAAEFGAVPAGSTRSGADRVPGASVADTRATGTRAALLAEAIRHYERAIALVPDYNAAHYALAQAARAAGDRAKADAALVRYQATRSAPPPIDDPLMAKVVELRSGPYEDLARGRWLSKQGRYADAVTALERAVRTSPTLLQAHVNLIAAYGAIGAADRADAAYRTAIALNPDLPEAHYNLGVLRLSQKRDDEAIAAFEAALASNGAYADAHNNLGFLLAQRGRSTEAAAHFTTALAANPAHRDAHFNLARLLLTQKQADAAIPHFERAAAVDDEKTALYLYYLADACARAGRLEDAERHAVAARTRAGARGQTELLSRIDDDLRRLRATLGARR